MLTNTPDHEAKCKRCGKCCRIVMCLPDGRRIHNGEHCAYLEQHTNNCWVYANRHEGWALRPFKCMNIAEAIEARSLPDDCAYVQDVKGYKCGVEE